MVFISLLSYKKEKIEMALLQNLLPSYLITVFWVTAWISVITNVSDLIKQGIVQ